MNFLLDGITAVTWQQLIMYAVGIFLIYLAINKKLKALQPRKSEESKCHTIPLM